MIARLRAAACFLVALPIGSTPVLEPDLRRAAPWFPVIGLLLGLVVALVGIGTVDWLGPDLSALLVVASLAWLTGGLHLDGLADTFDGLGGWRGDRERFLEIMRDPRVGAHGVVSLVLLLVGKILAVREHIDLVPEAVVLGVLVARALVPLLLVGWPYARDEGTGGLLHEGTRRADAVTALLFAAGIAVLAQGAAAAAGGVLVGLALAWFLGRRLRGLTGDSYGAVVEVVELAVWMLYGVLPW